MQAQPLNGIRVVGMTVVFAGPFAEMFLADWGAEVIRVENIQHFAAATRGGRARPPHLVVKNANPALSYADNEGGRRPWNRYAAFNYSCRNKLSCTIDVAKPEGKELFKRLIAVSDVFIENNAAGVVDRLGIGYRELKEVNPGLIMVSMPGYGNTGPYRTFHGMGFTMEATAGHTWLRGYPDLGPEATSVAVHGDACAGAMATYAVLIALRHRRRTGEGQFIDLSLAEASNCHQAEAVLDYTLNSRVRGTTGNRHPSAAPQGAYRCKGDDQWVAITVYDDRDWEGFCRALGNPDWTKDERFASPASRWNHQDELDRLVQDWTCQRSNYEVMYTLQKEGVAAGPVISTKEAFDDLHLREREQFKAVYHQECGTHLTPTFSWRARNNPNGIRMPAPLLGEHNEYVYKEILGVSDEEYTRLEKEGHIGMDYAPSIP